MKDPQRCYPLWWEDAFAGCWSGEGFRTLYGHAQSVEGYVGVTVLWTERSLGDSEARTRFHCPIYPRHLKTEGRLKPSVLDVQHGRTVRDILSWARTSMCWWWWGTGTNWGSLLLSHMVTSRFMFTANGSKPSCRPQMVKYLRVLTSLPKFILATWQTPRLHTGMKPGNRGHIFTYDSHG